MPAGADARTASRAVIGVGRVLLWPGGSLWIGRAAGRAQAHAHHAIQISLALTGRLHLRTGDASAWRDHAAAIVWPHERHQFDGGGETVAQVFVEPETPPGRALLARRADAPIDELPLDAIAPEVDELRTGLAAGVGDDVLVASARRLLVALCGEPTAAACVDSRVTRAIEFMRARADTPVSLAQAAAAAHLSPSRFRHLFVAQTGMSFRAYLLWARVEAAVGAAMGGLTWTEAAQAQGFADSAHLSRTCRRMFGIAPTMLVRERDAQPPAGP